MSVVGLLMAGGRSERMRAGGDATHKALRRVRGTTLMERNARALLDADVEHISVAVSAGEPDVRRAIHETIVPICCARSVTCDIVIEERALGNIGAAKLVSSLADAVLVVYVDNLTALDLRELVAFHRSHDYAATIATHVEAFSDPYGELTIEGDEVTGYAEKPVRHVWVSSGTCVLGTSACASIEAGAPTAVHQLFAKMRAAGMRVGAFRHAAPWVDVNDEPSLERAERLLAVHPAAFASAGP